MVSAFCVAGVATATTPVAPADIAGRWQSDREWTARPDRLTFDISPCGEGWCGVQVGRNGACGKTAMRVDQAEPSEYNKERIEFKGRVELASDTQAYVVRVNLFRDQDSLRITIRGNTGDEFELFRRNYSFQQLMVRSGDAVCKPDAKVS
jgi:hypothetical protein